MDSSRQIFHTPVLLNEVVALLNPKPGETYVDGTLGGGGHAAAIAERIGTTGTVVGIDLDPQAIAEAKRLFSQKQITAKTSFVQGSYADVDQFLSEAGIPAVHMLLVDLGISSFDLDASGRGFTFQKGEPLDMRFDTRSGLTAAEILGQYSEQELERLFREYGEERFSRKIARAVVATRQDRGGLQTTSDLFNLIKQALPAPLRFRAADSVRRIFQALRIEVNRELENLRTFLPKAFALLEHGGRLGVISFHSLEDRIVKQFFVEKSKGCVCPPDFPECRCGRNAEAKILTRKPVTAGAAEQAANPRSKPAKLRVIQKSKTNTP